MNFKHLIVAGSALLGATAVAPRAHAADPSSDAHLRRVTIKVQSVDPQRHIVTFQAQVNPEANVERNGQPIKIDQLKAGDEVRAAFDPNTGEVMKLEIQKGGARTPSNDMSNPSDNNMNNPSDNNMNNMK